MIHFESPLLEIHFAKRIRSIVFIFSLFQGLMKISLQEFQHMFPYLTSRIKVQPATPPQTEESVLFVPMECPILPLDTQMKCTDMLHETFDEENGPLWRVQHVIEDNMDAANLVRNTI